jgi:hypothetical protein
MSHPTAAPRKRSAFGLGSIIALALIVPAALLTFMLYRSWNQSRQEMASLTDELQNLATRNAALSHVYDVLQNKKFQFCNKSAYPVDISWVSAAYSDGKQLRMFDSSHCKAWHPVTVDAGETKDLLLSTNEEGCNWNGNVVYFGMRFSQEKEESSAPYNFVGLWRGFERECFTFR